MTAVRQSRFSLRVATSPYKPNGVAVARHALRVGIDDTIARVARVSERQVVSEASPTARLARTDTRALIRASGAMSTYLEPFDNLSAWGSISASSIIAGRTGTAMRNTGTGSSYTIFPRSSTTITMGFGFRVSSLAAIRTILQLRNSLTDNNLTMQVLTDGALRVRSGGTVGAILGTSAVGFVVVNTWVYIELQIYVADVNGYVKVKVDGTEILNVSGIDSQDLTTNDPSNNTVVFWSASGTTQDYDDMYVIMGPSGTFAGPITIPPGPTITQLDHLSARLARTDLRALTSLNITEGRVAQVALRSLVSLVPLGTFVNVWNGTAWVEKPLKLWDGSAFVDPTSIKTWNGTAWV